MKTGEQFKSRETKTYTKTIPITTVKNKFITAELKAR